jgi:hypothetical protein
MAWLKVEDIIMRTLSKIGDGERVCWVLVQRLRRLALGFAIIFTLFSLLIGFKDINR